MLWEVEIQPKGPDTERQRVAAEHDLLTHGQDAATPLRSATRGFLLEGNLSAEQARQFMEEVLLDAVVESARLASPSNVTAAADVLTVLPHPGVMDPAAQSVLEMARGLGLPLDAVRTFRRYYFAPHGVTPVWRRVLANDAIEQIIVGRLTAEHLGQGTPYTFRLLAVPLRDLHDADLEKLSRDGQLSLNLAEMRAIREHFRELGRDPTDVELETLAQTWSEHCSHKTLKGPMEFNGRRIENLLKETIFGATQEIRRRLGPDDWCVSVFEDNAGVVRFSEDFHACFKVETHNHPSAIEPYGGANTGLGGVIRDPLGTGLGATPICNTDVFCFAPPEGPAGPLPPGVLHPRKIMQGVVAGVRDYGNRMGIPTINGAVCFDERYLANPLVFCGTVGLIPVDRVRKEPKPGDLIVAVGGRTGRDGIHGATFSSIELTAESEHVSGGAVQIGNAIAEKKVHDVILQARDRNLYHAITDCGAGGFSSAVGEMAEKIGAVVHLDRAPLKYQGLSYTEIWISEAQERMVLAVPPENWPEFQQLCAGEDVEATAIGHFEADGRLRLLYQDRQVADLSMDFVHNGRPNVVRQATWQTKDKETRKQGDKETRRLDCNEALRKILASLNVCSKEWIIRQYDHEVQGGSVLKPLVGVHDDGPGDAAVIMPLRERSPNNGQQGAKDKGQRTKDWTGLAVGCGINPRYGELDPYWMAAAVIDEAVRNVVAVGADPKRIALLDNFCWGNTDRPEVLGSLVRAAEACRDVALALGTPFISGKDSLNNEYRSAGQHIAIPPTLLISALGRVPDVRRCVTMDLKEPGNDLFLVGVTRDEMGGSHYHAARGFAGGDVPRVDLALAPRIFAKIHEAIQRGLVRSCHDLSEGGLAAAIAEMAFAGEVGADLTELAAVGSLPIEVLLFSESPTRFLLEVPSSQAAALRECFGDLPLIRLGQTCKEPRLRIAGPAGEWIIWSPLAELKEAWQKPLRW